MFSIIFKIYKGGWNNQLVKIKQLVSCYDFEQTVVFACFPWYTARTATKQNILRYQQDVQYSNILYYTSSLARSAKGVVLITVDLTINLSTPIFFNIESLTPSVSVQITDQQREMCAQSNEKHRECAQKVLVDLMTDRPSTFYNTLRHYLSLENYRLNSEITKSAQPYILAEATRTTTKQTQLHIDVSRSGKRSVVHMTVLQV